MNTEINKKLIDETLEYTRKIKKFQRKVEKDIQKALLEFSFNTELEVDNISVNVLKEIGREAPVDYIVRANVKL